MSQLPGSARVNQYSATAGQTTFTYDFMIYDDDEITVQQNSTTLTLTTHYTVTGAGESGGGTIVLVTGATEDDIITLTGNTMVERETTFTNGGEFSATAINGEYNKILYLLSENVTELAKSVNLAVYDASFDAGIPTPVANRALKINATGTGFEMSTYNPDSAQGDAAASAAAAALSATAAETAETNAETAQAGAETAEDNAKYWASTIDLSAVGVDIVPDADSLRDLGTTAKRWADVWADDLTLTNDLGVGGDLAVTGEIAVNGTKFTVAAATGNTVIDGTLTVGGDSITATKQALYTYEVAEDTDGGGATAGSWETRPINIEEYDSIGATLSSNQITLPAGSYIMHVKTHHYNTIQTKTRVYDATNTTELGIIGQQHVSNVATAPMYGCVYFTLAGEAAIEVQQYTSGTQATSGMGLGSDTTGATEVFLSAYIIKVV